jgi:tetratricopeptide (TPR) repeat protein
MATPEVEPRALLADADAASAEGNDALALTFYEAALRASPEHPRALFRRGVTLQRLGRHDEALESLTKAAAAGAPPLTWLRIAESAVAAGDETRALEALRRAGAEGFDDEAALDVAALGEVVRHPELAELRRVVRHNRRPCADDQRFHALDFWIGDWLARMPDGREAGRNSIFPVLEGCALSENWTGASGVSGKSYSFFNAKRDTWQQLWIDDRGTVTHFTHGTGADGEVILFTDAADGTASGDGVRRLTFTRLDADHVRQLSEMSDALGAWTTEYDLAYERVITEARA